MTYFSKKLADIFDLFQCRQNPLVILQFLNKFADPVDLLSITILYVVKQ